MRYAMARYAEYREDIAYRIYVTDELYFSGHNRTHSVPFKELLGYVKKDDRSGDDIAKDVIKNAGLVVE